MSKEIILPNSIKAHYQSQSLNVVRVVGYSGNLLKVYLDNHTVQYWEGSLIGWNRLN